MKGDALREHAKTRNTARRLSVRVAVGDASWREREKPPLALWLHARATGERMPHAAVRQLIEHYTRPGDLILTDAREQAVQARRLNRRARPTRTTPAGSNVHELPPQPAQLAIIGDPAYAATIMSSLAAGGFIALDLAPAASTRLGEVVRALQDDGLQYWQHIVVADRQHINAAAIPTRQRANVILERAHRDLLVFRQPIAAAAAAAAASAWTAVVAA